MDVMLRYALSLGRSMDAASDRANVAGDQVELNANLKSLQQKIEEVNGRLERELKKDLTGLSPSAVETMILSIKQMQGQLQMLNVEAGMRKDRNTKYLTQMSNGQDIVQGLELAGARLLDLYNKVRIRKP